MKKTIIPGRTRKERAAWFAGGRPTTAKMSTFNKKKRTFDDFFVGKLRSVIVMNSRRQWRFKTPEAALSCAVAFKQHSILVAGGTKPPAKLSSHQVLVLQRLSASKSIRLLVNRFGISQPPYWNGDGPLTTTRTFNALRNAGLLQRVELNRWRTMKAYTITELGQQTLESQQ